MLSISKSSGSSSKSSLSELSRVVLFLASDSAILAITSNAYQSSIKSSLSRQRGEVYRSRYSLSSLSISKSSTSSSSRFISRIRDSSDSLPISLSRDSNMFSYSVASSRLNGGRDLPQAQLLLSLNYYYSYYSIALNSRYSYNTRICTLIRSYQSSSQFSQFYYC